MATILSSSKESNWRKRFTGFWIRQARRFEAWWLHLTSYHNRSGASTWNERMREQRIRLASWIILALLIGDGIGAFSAIGDLHAMTGIIIIAVGILLAAILNRLGHVASCGILLILVLTFAFLYVITPELETPGGGLDVDALAEYDLLILPLSIGIALFKPKWGLVLAVGNCVAILLDFTLQPHTPYLEQEMQRIFGGDVLGTIGSLARPIVLQVFVVWLAYLTARGLQRASIEAAQAKKELELQQRFLALQEQTTAEALAFVDQVVGAVDSGEQGEFHEMVLPADHLYAEAATRLNTQLRAIYRQRAS